MLKCFSLKRLSLFQSSCHEISRIRAGRALRSTSAKPPVPTNEDVLGLLQDLQKVLSSTSEAKAEKDTLSKNEYGEGYPASILEQMPLSPLMHPNLIKARKRYQEAKSFPSKDRTEFQLMLQKNPYAQALCTPVRKCNLTNTRLPSYFHIAFGIRKNPETGRPWILPSNLDPQAPKAVSKVDEHGLQEVRQVVGENRHGMGEEIEGLGTSGLQEDIDLSPSDTNESPLEGLVQDLKASEPQQSPDPNPQDAKILLSDEGSKDSGIPGSSVPVTKLNSETLQPNLPRSSHSRFEATLPSISGSHILSQSQALEIISALKQRDLRKVIPLRWKDKLGLNVNVNEIVWRQEMDTFVLKLLRMKVAELLRYMAKRSEYIQPCDTYGGVRKNPQIAAILWMGDRDRGTGSPTSSDNTDDRPNAGALETRAGESTSALPIHNSSTPSSDTSKDGPPAYAMYRSHDQFKPIYNLRLLLGEDYVRDLRQVSPRFKAALALIKRKRNTVETQMWLWKLMGFMASGEGSQGDDEP